MSVVSLTDVSVVRSSATIIDRVSWTVDEGERWVIVGPNGAGKTTLLQIVGAQRHPTTGTAQLLGETLGRVDVFELRPRIGVASDILADRIPRAESVEDVVISSAYGVIGRWRERYGRQDYEQARDLMEQFEVEHLAKRTFGTLSEGERKRVQIARAMMTDPELLLLDEPAAGMDIAGRERLVSVLSSLCCDPMAPTVVLVTHHLEEIPDGTTHALLLKEGHVVESGQIDETLTSELVTETFDFPLAVSCVNRRWGVRAARRYW